MWSATISIVAALVAVGSMLGTLLGALHAGKQREATEKELTLAAYHNSVQALIDLKQQFARQPELFRTQMESNPPMKDFIPTGMGPEEFLTFARGMWQFSYIHSVWNRGERLGLTIAERDGLKNEMLLWLQGLPGFYQVYRVNVSVLRVHNQDFISFLETKAYYEGWEKDVHERMDSESYGSAK